MRRAKPLLFFAALALTQLISTSARAQEKSAAPSGSLASGYELVDQEIQSVWRQFCANLRSGNVPGALLHVTEPARERYRDPLESLGDKIRKLPDSWSQPQLLALYGGDVAEYVVTQTVDGEARIHTIVFAKSPDGLWLIEQF